jgi:hypothetical protein
MNDPGDEHIDPCPVPVVDEYQCALRNLRRLATGQAGAYGGPVYLVGSGVGEFRLWPDYGWLRDLDIRCIVTPAIAEGLFGPHDIVAGDLYAYSAQAIAMTREQLKQSRRLSRALHCRVDFQFQVQSDPIACPPRYIGKPRLRLDTLPDVVFSAGLGDA